MTAGATPGNQARPAEADIATDIRDVNLAYLLLAQRLAREDRATAMVRLGLRGEMVDLVASLSLAQVVKLAGSSFLLCRFRVGDDAGLRAMTEDRKESPLKQAHASILLSSQQLEAAL
ncbi:flagellar transcriptional regulator FlhD [Ramlibacter tataouinensis]|nr:flagellar transcriptional regulator FlhD [Ramlibacter tataouinensis]WBY04023.1 flagellar transcriptional regulator FlhD [Ramlibacter tataouinensis]